MGRFGRLPRQRGEDIGGRVKNEIKACEGQESGCPDCAVKCALRPQRRAGHFFLNNRLTTPAMPSNFAASSCLPRARKGRGVQAGHNRTPADTPITVRNTGPRAEQARPPRIYIGSAERRTPKLQPRTNKQLQKSVSRCAVGGQHLSTTVCLWPAERCASQMGNSASQSKGIRSPSQLPRSVGKLGLHGSPNQKDKFSLTGIRPTVSEASKGGKWFGSQEGMCIFTSPVFVNPTQQT